MLFKTDGKRIEAIETRCSRRTLDIPWMENDISSILKNELIENNWETTENADGASNKKQRMDRNNCGGKIRKR